MAALRTKSILWTSDDPFDEWLGFSDEKNCYIDEPDYLVKKIPHSNDRGYIWAGWAFMPDRSRECITLDHCNAQGARLEVEEAREEGYK